MVGSMVTGSIAAAACSLLLLSLLAGGASSQTECVPTILLSPGRTATDTISHTATSSSSLKYCGMKEAFKMRPATVEKLNSCVRSTPAVYIHVKPEHILVGRRFGQRYLTSPEAFFTAARAAGIQLVVISFRDNQLAREVSSFEMKQRKPGTPKFERNARERFIDVNMTDSFRKKVEDYNRAVRAAKAANFPRGILHITFNEIVHDVCGTTKKVLRRACPRADNQQQCQERNGHTDKSHHERTLTGRVGATAAANLRSQLLGTEYEWMLDLEKASWPPSVPRSYPPLTTDHDIDDRPRRPPAEPQ